MRSHVVFKLFKYTDTDINSGNISVNVNVCANCMCICEEKSAGCAYNIILWQIHGSYLCFLSHCSLFVFVWPLLL